MSRQRFPEEDFGLGIISGLLVTREQRSGVELVRSSNEWIGDFESTDEAVVMLQISEPRPGHFASIYQHRSAVCQIDSG
jgi:hypothetical protein